MKKLLSTGAALGLVALLTAPVSAGPTTVIQDPLGDSNFVNDQGTGDGSFGDFNQAGAGNVSDLLDISVWNDAKNLYVQMEAQGVPPATQGLGYRFRVNPDGAGGSHCILIEAFWPGATNTLTTAEAHVRDVCAGGDPTPVKLIGNILTIPRSANKAFGKGQTLKAPQAQSFIYSGSSYPAGVIGPYMDTTKIGKDYKLVK